MRLITPALLATSLLTACATPQTPLSADPIAVVAAGSLREAMTDIARAHEARTSQKLTLSFAASGLLRERIEKGEAAQVFASADMGHPQKLADAGSWSAPRVFVRNQLCALTQAHLNLTPERLLGALLDPAIRLGTSTPKADPAGDYAWALFRKADALSAGAYATLDRKALQLTGGPSSPKPPAGRGAYAWVMDQGQADIFLTYCTNAVAAQQEVPRLKIVAVPPQLQVSAGYGLTVRRGAHPAAQAFADALLAPSAQTIFARYGFGSP
ncbi:molybdate ABC transporter substrate-binding protein [Limnohabitans sp. WS1]|uniref:molybdate ABC transporter substrate-binding protein n=1 Tax=Limnohabitans sp. WS1 TaxID=1100726 RepID=UPI000D331A8D|nr:molybdate ABC transporter substrate-binding protein [Limnohabitans sp. WS1]PUE20065.1 molybdate ABC transporter substrate-binding protein [Limnohabitans sp. WS1]